MEKPSGDDRQYRLVHLSNGIVALVIRDVKTEVAGAALKVGVGNLCDPHDLPGLAHLCEHALFLGTKKYPRESEYSEFLSDHAGNGNAFTTMDQTTFYFQIDQDSFEGALDRFSQFFISPLFDSNCTEREVRAVDSESKAKLQVRPTLFSFPYL